MSNSINQTAADLNLEVSGVKVEVMNPVIFSTKYLSGLRGSDIVKDGDKVFKVDTVANTATEITAKSLATAAEEGLMSVKDINASEVATAISFGLVKEISMTRAKIATNGHSGSIAQFAKGLGLKVLDVKVDAQNKIIFQTKGIASLSGLTELEGKYYKLDTVANTATIIDPDAVAKDAAADLLKGKDTDLVEFVTRYNLISAITFGIKADAKEDADSAQA